MQSKLPNVGTTIFTTMSALAAKHGAINLSQGFPDFDIDPKLKEYVQKALIDNHVQYAPMPGRLDLREAISKIIYEKHAIFVNPEDEVTITAGATQAIFSAIAAVIQPGDEALLFDPAYDCYDPSIRLFGGKPIHLKLRFPSYSVDWQEVEQKISDRTRLIIVNNPVNPAGSVWSQTDLTALEKIVSNHPNLFIISDEVYEYLQFEGTHQSVLKSDLLRKRSFVTYSFGKTLHVTGWKIGYCIAPPTLTAEFRKVHQFNVFCVNNTMQVAILNYLNTSNALSEIAPFYKRKQDLFLNAISKSRFKALPGSGTYFCLLDYSIITDENDLQFAQRMTQEFGVASIPVSVFYEDLTDQHVLRFCFAKKDETLLKASEKLCLI